jgi:hypothetical protein
MKVMAIITHPPEVRGILSHLLTIARAPPGLDHSALT